MVKYYGWRRPHKVRSGWFHFVCTFVVACAVCAFFTTMTVRHKNHGETVNMEKLIEQKCAGIQTAISKLLYKAQTLGVFVQHFDDSLEWFDWVAPLLVKSEPAIKNVLVAPAGIVAKVYPLEGNEAVLGLNFLSEGAGNREAVISREKKDLVFGGPFELVQGGMAFAGRQPVWLGDPVNGSEGGETFWGFVSVTLDYPEALEAAHLQSLEREGVLYEVWRINPDTGEHQTIAGRHFEGDPYKGLVERKISLFNAEWYFRMMPQRAWYEDSGNLSMIAVGFLISLLMACIVRKNVELTSVKNELEEMLCIDALTGLLNRQGLFQILDPLFDTNTPFSLCFFDFNYFKQINDTYGHRMGDKALVEFAVRMRQVLTPRHKLARVGGDEFVLVNLGDEMPTAQTDAGQKAEEAFWLDVQRQFERPIFTAGTTDVFLSFSRGTAYFPADGTTADELVNKADARMYEDKNKRYSREQRRRRTDAATPDV